MTPSSNNENYRFFLLNKEVTSSTGIRYVPQSDNITLKKLRMELWQHFKIPKERRIFYIDEDNDIISIDWECEFREMWQLARHTVANEPIQLIVGPYTFHVPNDDHVFIPPQLKTENSSSDVEQNTDADSSSMKKGDKKHNKSNKQNKSKNMEAPQELDTSLRCELPLDTPPSWFTKYMETMKKEMISTISKEITEYVMETLNKHFHSSASYPPDKLEHLYQPYLFVPRRHSEYHCNLNDKKQRKMMYQDEEQLSDASIERVDEPQNIDNAEDPPKRSLQEKINLLQDAICDYGNVKEKKKKKKHYQQIAQMSTKNLDNDICNGQQLASPKNKFVSRKDLPQADQKPYDERLHLETLKMLENELRMSCSVTGHQMLDEDRRNKDLWSYDSHVDNNSTCDSLEVDDTFEIIHLPDISTDANKFPLDKSITVQRQHDDSQDSSASFELLPSPTSACMDEDLLTNKETKEGPELIIQDKPESMEKPEPEERVEEQQPDNSNPSKFPYILRSTGKFYGHLGVKKCSHIRAMDIIPMWHRIPSCIESSHDSSSYGDVRNSHPSYMPVNQCKTPQSQRSCQSQTDLIDFTQSFHSHTTSVTTDDTTDITEIYADACDNGKYGEQMSTTSRSVQETAVNATAKDVEEIDPMAVSSKNDFVGGGWVKKSKTNEKYRFIGPLDGGSRAYPFAATDVSTATSQHPRRENGSTDKPISNGALQRRCNSEQSLGTAEPVHILPETLVTAAAQFGSFAYIAAREIFDRIRTHGENAAKRRDKVRQ